MLRKLMRRHSQPNVLDRANGGPPDSRCLIYSGFNPSWVQAWILAFLSCGFISATLRFLGSHNEGFGLP